MYFLRAHYEPDYHALVDVAEAPAAAAVAERTLTIPAVKPEDVYAVIGAPAALLHCLGIQIT